MLIGRTSLVYNVRTTANLLLFLHLGYFPVASLLTDSFQSRGEINVGKLMTVPHSSFGLLSLSRTDPEISRLVPCLPHQSDVPSV